MAPKSEQLVQLREQRLLNLLPLALVNGIEVVNMSKGGQRNYFHSGHGALSEVRHTDIGARLSIPSAKEIAAFKAKEKSRFG